MAQNKQSKTTKATDKKATKKTPAKKAAASKKPAKKAASKKPAKKAVASKKTVAKKTVAKKFVAKDALTDALTEKATGVTSASKTTTTTTAIDGEAIWNVFQNDSANISATVNGKVIYANDIVTSSLKKRVLSWFKR
jgi:hypothetical protein